MIIKELHFRGRDDEGNIFCQLIPPSGSDFIKTAAAYSSNLHLRIKRYIEEEVVPTDKGIYVLVNALGASEYWGQNSNSDIFPEKALINSPPEWNSLSSEEMKKAAKGWPYGFPTFMNAYPFKHHVSNKDPSRAFGRVELVVWNPEMRRVELIIYLDRALAEKQGAQDVIQRIENGEYPDVSMGCSVPYDVCSICQHKSKTRNDYCQDLKKMLGKILSDGRRVGMVNTFPKFFDISFVFIGADKTAKVMAKLAAAGNQICLGSYCSTNNYNRIKENLQKVAENHRYSSHIAAHIEDIDPSLDKIAAMFSLSTQKNASHKKLSELIKDIPAGKFSREILPKLEQSEPDIPTEVLNQLGSQNLNTACSTPAHLGIVLKPREFQRVVLVNIGEVRLADRMDAEDKVFPPTSDIDNSIQVSRGSIDEGAMRRLMSLVPFRSAVEPLVNRRIIRIVVRRPVTHENSGLMRKISAAYNGYRQNLLMKIAEIQKTLVDDPIVMSMALDYNAVDLFSDRMKLANADVFGPRSFAYFLGAYYDDRRDLHATTKVAEVLGSLNPNMVVNPIA